MMKNIVKSTFPFLFILFVWVLFEDKLVGMFDKNILPFLSNVEFNIISTVVFFLLMIFPAYTIYQCFRNKFFIPYYSTFLFLSFLSFIYAKYRLWGDYISIPPVIGNIGYTDCVIILLALFLISCIHSYVHSFKHSNQKSISNNCVFRPDSAIAIPELDILDYSESAKQLAKDLETIQSENSCSIGLIAPWGTGKTSYLNLLEYHLSNKKFIIIKFNPRHSYKASNIQKDFFEELFSKLKRFDSRFSSSFHDYLKAINVLSANKVFSFLFALHKTWSKESEKEKINHAIRRLNKRIIVIIDDFDRLLSDEIIEVFKLIDGNASFTNLIFITAYDKKHINEIIGKTYSNENTFFSDKFFSIEMQIPLRPYEKIQNYLLANLLDSLSVKNEDKEFFEILLANRMDILKKNLTTLRDVKRFLNLFLRQYKHVQEEVEFEDFFLLYIIKYRYIEEYLILYKKEYIQSNIIKGNNRYFCNNELNVGSKDILEVLFSETNKYSIRSINNELAFDIYFHESVYGGLTIQEMNNLFQIPLNEAQIFIDNSVSEKTLQDLLSFLDSRNILAFKSKKTFRQFLDLLVYINCKNYDTSIPYFTLLKLIYEENKNQISNIYGYEEIEYKTLITSILTGNYPYYPNYFTKGICIGIINKEFNNKIIFSKEDILGIAKNALNDLRNHDCEVKSRHIELLYSCISDIDQKTRLVKLDEEACSNVSELIKKQPSGYFENFVHLGMISINQEFNSVACEPFWEQLFGVADNLKSYINGLDDKSVPKINLVKNFWRLYENNNYKPIEFQNQGNVQEMIDDELFREVEKLNELLSIEVQFNEYENGRIEKRHRVENRYYLNQYQKLLNRIDNIALYISKTGDIKKKIKNAISLITTS